MASLLGLTCVLSPIVPSLPNAICSDGWLPSFSTRLPTTSPCRQQTGRSGAEDLDSKSELGEIEI